MDPYKFTIYIYYNNFVFGVLLLIFVITTYLAISRNWEWLESRPSPMPWLGKNYVAILLTFGFTVIILAVVYWIWDIRGEIGEIVSLLSSELSTQNPSAENIRNLAYAIGALLAAVALSATIPFQLIKVWVNERLAKTTEQGHMTDRITKAVEQLGAEKTIMNNGKQETVPNLEVRLGAIYALERIAQDSLRDHILVMEILCAYVRLNSPRKNGTEFKAFQSKYTLPIAGLSEHQRQEMRIREVPKEKEYDEKKKSEVNSLPPMRLDVQAALTVIGRRSILGVNSHKNSSFRLNLSGCNLQKAKLIGNFSEADFSDSLWDGATLSGEFENCFVDSRKPVAMDWGVKEMDALVRTGRPKPHY